MYPGSITPFNVWDLPLYMWWGFAQSADDYLAESKKERHG
jgi:hypothetical protein